MEHEDATRNQKPRLIVEVDIKNAHNIFPCDVAMQKVIAVALADSGSIKGCGFQA
jgi:hypothetical protein